MTTISILGTGTMSEALSELFQRAGAEVQVVSHADAAEASFDGEVVVLAVPYTALADIANHLGDKLGGKIVVDITNPVDFSTGEPLAVPAGSATAELAQALPDAHVVKAFNTNFSATLAAGAVGPEPLSVILAGDDADAKKALEGMVAASGAQVFDLGGVARAAQLEAIGYTQIALASTEQIGWTRGVTLLK